MQHIETRTQLIEHIMDYAPVGGISRACHEGEVNVLGGFRVIPPGTRPGWIVVVTSRFEQVWIVAVQPNEDTRKFEVREIKRVPWESYVGIEEQVGYSIYNGDNLLSASVACRMARERYNDRTRNKTTNIADTR